MTSLTRKKLSLYIAVIFVAGAASGSVLALRSAQKRSHPPTMEKVCHQMERQLKTRLELTDEQFARIRPLLDEGAREIRQIHSRTLDEIDEAIRKNHAAMARHLTPDQQRRLEAMDAERRVSAVKRHKQCDARDGTRPPTR